MRSILARPAVCLAAFVLASVAAADAAPPTFPYETTVAVDSADVRSGPGDSPFYVTSRMRRGESVTVVRHDPGGWRMIQPPTGSFSYIRPEHVDLLGGDRGVVSVPRDDNGRDGRSVVRVGSQFSDDASITGRYLKTGQPVTVLGSAIVTVGGQQREMLRILPPPREYRWIRGDSLGESGGITSLTATADPALSPGAATVTFGDAAAAPTSDEVVLSSPTQPRLPRPEIDPEPVAKIDTSALDAEVQTSTGTGAARLTGASPDAIRAERDRLAAIDRRFREMVQLDPSQWQLDGIESDYRAMLAASPSESMQVMLSKRLAAVAKRQEVFARYDEFRRLTEQTERREQELLRQQQSVEAAPIGTGDALAAIPFGSVAGPSLGRPAATPIGPTEYSSDVTYSGAGMVVAQQRGVGLPPQYVLVSPTGQTLAILQPAAGVPMDSHIGQARGIVGERTFDPARNVDVIAVQRLDIINLAD